MADNTMQQAKHKALRQAQSNNKTGEIACKHVMWPMSIFFINQQLFYINLSILPVRGIFEKQ